MRQQKLLIVTLLLTILLLKNGLYAQEPVKVVRPSPDMSSLFKYVEYPVDFKTGLPQISIPLYEVKSGSLSLPITLSYHSSGRQVNDETGAVGLGWTLMAGGAISRTVYGDADDNDGIAKFPAPWKSTTQLMNQQVDENILFLGKINNEGYTPWYDTQYDIFSYFVNGLSGKFVFRDDNNEKVPVFLPKKPYVIKTHKNTDNANNHYFDYIELIDDQGILYHFSARETSSSGSGYASTSAWQLTKLVSADKSDSIVLKYTNFSKRRTRPIQQTTVIDNWQSCLCNYCSNPYEEPFPNPNITMGEATAIETYSVQRLTEIEFSSGKVVFNLKPENDVVESMQVLDNNGNTIRTVVFSMSELDRVMEVHEVRSNQKLDKISIQGSNNNHSIETYQFDYYSTVYATGSTTVNARFRDWWGYYNASGSSDMRPYISGIVVETPLNTNTINIGCTTGIGGPNLSATKSGILKKVTFPTGGSSEFTYELNQYKDTETGVGKESGGLRIAQIKTFDGEDYMYKTYSYGEDGCGYGYLHFIPDGTKNMTNNIVVNYEVSSPGLTVCRLKYRQRIYSTEVIPLFSYIASKPVIYKQVTEYWGLGTNTIGKTVYTYDNDDIESPTQTTALAPTIVAKYNYCKTSSLIKKEVYENTSPEVSVNPNYQLVKELVNKYSVTSYDEEKLWGLRVQKQVITSPTTVVDNVTGGTGHVIGSFQFAATRSARCGNGEVGPFNVFSFGDYFIEVAKKELISTTETLYTDNGEITTLTSYKYNSNHLLDEKHVTDSKGNDLSTLYKYPLDFASSGNVYDNMTTRNILTPIIEQIDLIENTHIQSLRTNYYDWGNNIIAPISVDVKNGNSQYETRTNYKYNVDGKIVETSKKDDIKSSYHWGYNNTYPVAKIDGLSYDELISTSGLVEELNKLDDGAVNLKTVNESIRNLVPNCMVNTYTYKPLVGVTAQTDPNNKTLYYDYDDFGRLKTVKDHNRYILKKYNYNYYNNLTNGQDPLETEGITDAPADCYQTWLLVAVSGGSGNYTYEWTTAISNVEIINPFGSDCAYRIIGDDLSGVYSGQVTCKICDQENPANCIEVEHRFDVTDIRCN